MKLKSVGSEERRYFYIQLKLIFLPVIETTKTKDAVSGKAAQILKDTFNLLQLKPNDKYSSVAGVYLTENPSATHQGNCEADSTNNTGDLGHNLDE